MYKVFSLKVLCLVLLTFQRYTSTTNESNRCIPVMGFGYNDDTMDFVPHLLQSIDFCVDRFLIVAPRRAKEKVTLQARVFSTDFFKIETLLLPRRFIGVAETWNSIIRLSEKAPWFLICAYDVMFLPGQLELFGRRFWKRSGNISVNIEATVNFAHTGWLNMKGNK